MRHETELDGVEMRVVHVSRKVAIVADRVLRVPPLPNAAFAAACYEGPSGCGTGEAAAFHAFAKTRMLSKRSTEAFQPLRNIE